MSDVNKTNILEQANAPPDTELVIPENLPSIKVMNPGLYKNLCEQVTSIYKHCNELSYGTRKRHYEATKRFCAFLADNFRLQKFKNVEDRHFRAYVEYLIESGASPATIQSDLSGIRFFHGSGTETAYDDFGTSTLEGLYQQLTSNPKTRAQMQALWEEV